MKTSAIVPVFLAALAAGALFQQDQEENVLAQRRLPNPNAPELAARSPGHEEQKRTISIPGDLHRRSDSEVDSQISLNGEFKYNSCVRDDLTLLNVKDGHTPSMKLRRRYIDVEAETRADQKQHKRLRGIVVQNEGGNPNDPGRTIFGGDDDSDKGNSSDSDNDHADTGASPAHGEDCETVDNLADNLDNTQVVRVFLPRQVMTQGLG